MVKKNWGEGNDWTEGNIKFLWLDTEVGLVGCKGAWI